MANWLTNEINKYLSSDETLLDLCCGNGSVSDGFVYSQILGVDVCEEYLEFYKKNLPNSQVINFNLEKIADSEHESFSKLKYDNVLCIDGVEHLEKHDGEKLIKKMESMANKRVIIFTPENAENPNVPVLNTPHNAWGIKGGDQWQVHKSAFPRQYFINKGYKVIQYNKVRNVYDGSYYYEMLYILDK